MVADETRTRQLLTRRYSKSTPRFETFLQTIRRPYAREQLLSQNLLGVKTNFFIRAYSTTASDRLIGKFVQRAARVSPATHASLLSAYQVVTQRYRVLPTVEARDRTNYTASLHRVVATARIDGRFARSKSPRSRQYVLRTEATAATATAAALNVARQNEYLQSLCILPTESRCRRSSRRFVRVGPTLPTVTSHTAVQNMSISLPVVATPRKAKVQTHVLARISRSRVLSKFAIEPRSAIVARTPNALKHTAIVATAVSATTRNFALACARLSRETSVAAFDASRARL